MEKKKTDVKNYREKYKRYYGIEFGEEFDVHHLDLNHDNNEISNLLLLPKELHHKYHMALCWLMPEDNFVKFDVRICGDHLDSHSLQLQAMENFIQVLNECKEWYDKKFAMDMQKYFNTCNK